MDFVVSGVITQVMQPQSGVSQRSGQPWQSQEFVLTYEQGQYPKSLCFRVFGSDKLQQFAIQQNEMITAHLNITCQQSRNGGYFNSIDCWKVERAGQQQVAQQSQYQQHVQQQFPPQVNPQGQPVQQPMTGAAPFPPQQPVQQQPVASPFPPQPAGVNQPAQGQQLPFPPAQ